MLFIFSRADVTIVNFQTRHQSSTCLLSACGLYLDSATLLLADNSSSIPHADPVLSASLLDSALIDMSGQTNIAATDNLIASPQLLVLIVPRH